MSDAPVSIEVGAWFKLKLAGDDGNYSFYKVRSHHPTKDEVTVYGGDLDPNGRRQFHTFTHERLRHGAAPLTPRELTAVTRPMKPLR